MLRVRNPGEKPLIQLRCIFSPPFAVSCAQYRGEKSRRDLISLTPGATRGNGCKILLHPERGVTKSVVLIYR